MPDNYDTRYFYDGDDVTYTNETPVNNNETGDPRMNAHGGRHPQQETSPGLPVRKGLIDKVLDSIAKKNTK